MKSAGCTSCHTATDQPTMHANPAVVLGCVDCHGGDAAVKAPRGLAANDPAYRELIEQAHVLPRLPESWHYPDSANPPQSYGAGHAGKPRVPALRQSERPAGRAPGLRRLPSADHPGRRARPARHRRDAVGRRRLQQRHPAQQALHHRRGVHSGRPAGDAGVAGPGDREHEEARRAAAAAAAAVLGDGAARRPVPDLRARRAQHREPVPRDRGAQRLGPDPAARGAGTARHPAVQPRRRDRPAGRDPGPEHHQDAPERPVHLVSSAPTTSRATTGPRAAAPATSSTPTIATRAMRAATPRSGITAPRSRSTRRSRRTSRAIRCATRSPTRSRPASA